MRISDWSSDVCSSDLGFSYADISSVVGIRKASIHHHFPSKSDLVRTVVAQYREEAEAGIAELERNVPDPLEQLRAYIGYWEACIARSEEHTSELQSLMRISYAVFCVKKKKNKETYNVISDIIN